MFIEYNEQEKVRLLRFGKIITSGTTFYVSLAKPCFSNCEPHGQYRISSGDYSYYATTCCSNQTVVCYSCERSINRDLFSPNVNVQFKVGCFLCSRCTDMALLHFCGTLGCGAICGDDQEFCNYCDGDRVQVIYPYNYDVMRTLKILGNDKGGLYFGVEYEVKPSFGSTIVQIAKSINADFPKEALCVHDGSLRDDDGEGLEIVSAPMPFGMQKDFQRRLFEKEYPYKSYDQKKCSIHVHMSRDAFTPIQLAKFKIFFYAPMNRWFIEKIGGRTLQSGWGREYARLTDEYQMRDLVYVHKDIYSAKAKKKSYFKDPDPDNHDDRARYTAVNCTNANTIEVRIFKGCDKLATMYKNLEFCKSVFDFTKSSIVPYNKIGDCIPEYLKYIDKFKKTYPNLNKFIERYKIIPPENPVERVPEGYTVLVDLPGIDEFFDGDDIRQYRGIMGTNNFNILQIGPNEGI